MKYIITISLIILATTLASGQSAADFYNRKDFQSLIKLEPRSDNLNAYELYIVGLGFFRLEEDSKAVELYDKALAKGLDSGFVHFYKGLSLMCLKRFEDALKEIDFALDKEPTNQEYMNEKGVILYSMSQGDLALEVFEQAARLPATFPEPYYWIARIHQEKKEYDKALYSYYEAVQNLPEENNHYLASLKAIGQLEYFVAKDYDKAARAYVSAIQLDSANYELYSRLIRSYNAGKRYAEADSIFSIVKSGFERGNRFGADTGSSTIQVAQFVWHRQTVSIIRSLVEPREATDISYSVSLLGNGDMTERQFVVEKVARTDGEGWLHLLCEDNGTGIPLVYPYGWTTDEIPLEDLEKAVVMVLDGKIQAAAVPGAVDK